VQITRQVNLTDIFVVRYVVPCLHGKRIFTTIFGQTEMNLRNTFSPYGVAAGQQFSRNMHMQSASGASQLPHFQLKSLLHASEKPRVFKY